MRKVKLQNEKVFKSLNSGHRKELIMDISGTNLPLVQQALVLNELVLFESLDFLQKHGQEVNVKSVKADRKKYKRGYCYHNSFQKMSMGNYDYVEGFVYNKTRNHIFSHAWNRDKNGNHIDFTLENASECEYFGAVISNRKVYDVGLYHGGVSYCVIPFLGDV